MVSGLAFYLAQKFNPQLVQQMKLLYEDELARALAEDGSEMTSKMWEIRALKKLAYLIFPFSVYFGAYDLARISQRHTHQSNIDLRVGSIVAHANSLPPANRKHIK